jgi:hypothetical protein
MRFSPAFIATYVGGIERRPTPRHRGDIGGHARRPSSELIAQAEAQVAPPRSETICVVAQIDLVGLSTTAHAGICCS